MEDFEKFENTESEIENAAEETAPAEVETIENEVDSEMNFNVDIPEAAQDNEAEQFGEAPKKKKLISTPIIIAAIILVAAIVAGSVYFLFFNNSVAGTWVFDENTSSADQASKTKNENVRYYTFNNDGSASISVGTIQVNGTWKYTNDSSASPDEGKKFIEINILPAVSGTFEVKVEGNIFTGKTLTLTTQNTPIKFVSASKVEPKLEVSKKFKPVKEVTGSWKYKDTYSNYNYKFNEDGTCLIASKGQSGDSSTKGVYTVDTKKKIITVTFISDQKQSSQLPYVSGKKGNELTLSTVKFTREK